MIQITRESWRQRNAFRLTNGVMEVVTLPGGGHIAEVRFAPGAGPAANCLWAAPWPTADPGAPAATKLAAQYGADPAGTFLASYTGHALCLDLFGAPSPEESAAGIALHGEAAVREWIVEPAEDGCTARAHLPAAGLNFERTLRMADAGSVLFVSETATNLRLSQREIHWVEHVSFGPPLLIPGQGSVHASLDHAVTWPLGYEGHARLRDNAPFEWPTAPGIDGSPVNLELPFERPGTGFVAAARVRRNHEIAFIAAMNPTLRLAILYCFRREDFPWLAIWEENCARPAAPWSGTAQVRGMEFGTTPMPLGRDGIRHMGALFDTPGSRVIPPHAAHTARYAIALAAIPSDWSAITGLEVRENALHVIGPQNGDCISIAAEGVCEFLHAPGQ